MQSDWKPGCSLEMLQIRSQALGRIRSFFEAKGVMEVETPLLGNACGTDPSLMFFTTQYSLPPHDKKLFLQSSPEFAMKRLLAAGSGSIFQICKAFRNGETGRLHNPEFTILEWYRVDFSLSRLMDEIAELLQVLFEPYQSLERVQRFSYREVFHRYTGINPLDFSLVTFSGCAQENNLPEAELICGNNHSMWLDFLFSHLVQPKLGSQGLCMIYDYPACQASLAKLKNNDLNVSERVEVFLNGVELGNGFYELCDAKEQSSRFDAEINERKLRGEPAVVKDQRFLDALVSGLPDCSGVAIGLDRLLLMITGNNNLNDVLAFPVARA